MNSAETDLKVFWIRVDQRWMSLRRQPWIASYNKLLYAIINTLYKTTTIPRIKFAKTHLFEIQSFPEYWKLCLGDQNFVLKYRKFRKVINNFFSQCQKICEVIHNFVSQCREFCAENHTFFLQCPKLWDVNYNFVSQCQKFRELNYNFVSQCRKS